MIGGLSCAEAAQTGLAFAINSLQTVDVCN